MANLNLFPNPTLAPIPGYAGGNFPLDSGGPQFQGQGNWNQQTRVDSRVGNYQFTSASPGVPAGGPGYPSGGAGGRTGGRPPSGGAGGPIGGRPPSGGPPGGGSSYPGGPDGGSGGAGPLVGRDPGDLTAPGGDGGDVAELMRLLSTGWLNLTVVTQPDMSKLINHPVFRNIISSIAHSAMQVVAQMVQSALQQSMEQAQVTINQQMTERLSPLARPMPAYSLSQLTMMDQSHIDAYNPFAHQIGAPIISSAPPEDEPVQHARPDITRFGENGNVEEMGRREGKEEGIEKENHENDDVQRPKNSKNKIGRNVGAHTNVENQGRDPDQIRHKTRAKLHMLSEESMRYGGG
ncbi:hypothetical protein B0H13DRAFT_1858211 [Mycena leptocephala]|nr:hypothetical protein B0H13DRAFT_1858211 [Mycena leptocephala]